MSNHEHALVIDNPAAKMLGIVSMPAPGKLQQRTGVVIVVGGAQYRVGSHRQFVLLARVLAAAGYPVLRFDFPGMGDSPGEMASFEESAPHIAAAIHALHSHIPHVERVVLWGLCDGASASLLYLQATQDPRVTGIVLLNPWVRSEAGLARAQIKLYYRHRIMQPAFWRKLFQGNVSWNALRGLASNFHRMRQRSTEQACFPTQMAQGLKAFKGSVLLLLSEHDLTAAEFMEHAKSHPAWRNLLLSPQVNKYWVSAADHTFSSASSQREVEALVLTWLMHTQSYESECAKSG